MTLVTHPSDALNAEKIKEDLDEGVAVARRRFRDFKVVDEEKVGFVSGFLAARGWADIDISDAIVVKMWLSEEENK